VNQPLSTLTAPRGVPRRYSSGALPAYRHVPGLTPHPVRHPEGHSYAAPEVMSPIALHGLPESWRTCQEYLLGVDLFNRRYLWEAHEAWELVWIGAGKISVCGVFCQGLIQVSAALLRAHIGTPEGASNLLGKARRNLDVVQDRVGDRQRPFMGVAIETWWQSVSRSFEGEGDPHPFLELEI
jgi:hypothetical protein